MARNKYWFRPKHYGYGAVPITWEGWFIVIMFGVFLISLMPLLAERPDYFTAGVLALSISLIWVSQIKTEGDWRWRWG